MNSISALEKISLVMDFITTRAELGSLGSRIILREDMSMGGFTHQDLEAIINNLFEADLLKEKEMIRHEDRFGRSGYGFDYYATINYDAFDNFKKKLINRLNELKLNGNNENKVNGITGVSFDENNGVLRIGNYSINIDLQNKKTLANDLLSFLKKDFNEEADYFDIANHITGGIDKIKYSKDKYHLKIFRACKDIQEKVKEQTKYKIEDFLLFNSSLRGSVKINPKYL